MRPSQTENIKKPTGLEKLFPALFCMAAFAVSMLLYDRVFTTYDDGVAAQGARMVLHGAVPYRDFWTIYAPASYYANAVMFALAGESFLSLRIALPVMVLIQAGFLYGIIRRTENADRLHREKLRSGCGHRVVQGL